MKKILIILAIIIAIGLVGFFFLMPGKQTYQYEGGSQQTGSAPVSSASTSTAPQAVTSGTNANSACVSDLAAQVKAAGTQYEAGTVLVSFSTGTSQADANVILKTHGLALDSGKPSNFSTLAWGTVTVSKGDELKTVCALETDTQIKHATLNTIMSLHD